MVGSPLVDRSDGILRCERLGILGCPRLHVYAHQFSKLTRPKCGCWRTPDGQRTNQLIRSVRESGMREAISWLHVAYIWITFIEFNFWNDKRQASLAPNLKEIQKFLAWSLKVEASSTHLPCREFLEIYLIWALIGDFRESLNETLQIVWIIIQKIFSSDFKF